MFKKLIFGALNAVALLCATHAAAGVITLDFEGVGNQANILDFYNGGSDSQGNSGTNYGIGFGSNTLGLIDADAGGDGNFANEPTSDTIMFFLTGTAVLNYAPGFDTGFSFYYTTSRSARVDVYDDLDATGNLLGSILLDVNWQNGNCGGDPTGQFCNWDIGAVSFAGMAKSIDFGGTVDQVGFDNITFGSIDPSGNNDGEVPVPGTLLLMGLGLFGLSRSRRMS